jgi:hypothetical protein
LGLLGGIALGVGVLASYVFYRASMPPRFAACAYQTYDYVSYLRHVNEVERWTNVAIHWATTGVNAREGTDPKLASLRLAYLRSKADHLAMIRPLVERQIEVGGADYSCTEPGGTLFTLDLAYPTYEDIVRRANEQKASREQVFSWKWLVQTTIAPATSILVFLFGLWVTSHKERRAREAEPRVIRPP